MLEDALRRTNEIVSEITNIVGVIEKNIKSGYRIRDEVRRNRVRENWREFGRKLIRTQLMNYSIVDMLQRDTFYRDVDEIMQIEMLRKFHEDLLETSQFILGILEDVGLKRIEFVIELERHVRAREQILEHLLENYNVLDHRQRTQISQIYNQLSKRLNDLRRIVSELTDEG